MKLIMTFFIQLSSLYGQDTGKISTLVVDSSTKEALIGANVLVKNTDFGGSTDIDGTTSITILPGNYTVVVTYIGYNVKTVNNVKVELGETTNLKVELKQSVIEVDEVNVSVKLNSSTSVSVLKERKNSDKIVDIVSSELISKSGDSNAAEAFRRVTGVSVVGGKFVYVRGLGDRYTNTQVNNSPIPSPEPEKRTVPLNLFSTSIIESISAIKTFTPDMPGTFAGGTVQIKTKAYPDRMIVDLKTSVSDNSNFRLDNPYQVSFIGKNDIWGYDNGHRELPQEIPKTEMINRFKPIGDMPLKSWFQKLGELGGSFNSDYKLKEKQIIQPLSIGLDLGNKFKAGKNIEYGFFLNSGFKNNVTNRDEQFNRYSSNDSNTLNKFINIINNKSGYNTQSTFGFSTGVKYKDSHEIKLYNLYTHSSKNETFQGVGSNTNIDDGLFIKHYYVEKSIYNTTLTGAHRIKRTENFNSKIDWKINSGHSTLYEPDTKFHNYYKNEKTNSFILETSSSKAGNRDFTNGIDKNRNYDINYSLSNNDASKEIKLGVSYQNKNRTFKKRSFYYDHSRAWTKDILEISENDQFGSSFASTNMFSENNDGLLLLEVTDGAARNAYDADENYYAGYLMTKLPLSISRYKLEFLGGLRIENYLLDLSPYNPVTGSEFFNPIIQQVVNVQKDETDIFPSLNLKYSNKENFQLRASYTSTVARGEFREIAPFAYQEFYGGDVAIGFPGLKTSRIRNYDLRYEKYLGAGEIASVSLFHKNFDKPIESALIAGANGYFYKMAQNANSATTSGFEFDLRKRLPLIPLTKGSIVFSSNITISDSKITPIDTVEFYNGAKFPNAILDGDRSLQGHSKYLVNIGIDMSLNGYGEISLYFNTYSKRISKVGAGSVGNEYEYPFNSLNFSAKKFSGPLSLSIKIKNLLNSTYTFGVENSRGQLFTTREYNPGVSFNLGIHYKIK